jgi:DNA-binding FadR family transcriptional regulator
MIAPLLRPLPLPRHRSAAVRERLTEEIDSGRIAPGDRLPTEQAMCAAFGVSRPVLREALSALHAEGLIVSRQGAGRFVADDAQHRPFRIDPDGLTSIAEVVNVMELRMAVEVEAAGLAAERARPPAQRGVARALAAMQRAVDRGEAAIDQDFAFHRAVAAATGNPQFSRFLEYLGRFTIPRLSVRIEPDRLSARAAYLRTIQFEHMQIDAAIQRHDVAAARDAMRRHLTNGRERYRGFMAGAAERDAPRSAPRRPARPQTSGHDA